MGEEKQKVEISIPKDELQSFMDSLGQGMAGGCLNLGDRVLELENVSELKLSLKAIGDSYVAKLKIKRMAAMYTGAAGAGAAAGPATAAAEGAPAFTGAACATPDTGKPKYKDLKKRMKKPWKMIKEALAAGALPDAGIVQQFMHDSELMISYPGKGDEYYPEYAQAMERFAAAFEAGDVSATQQAVMGLDQLKKACHDRHA